MRIPCYLELNSDGSVAELIHAGKNSPLKGLPFARFGVKGPFLRIVEGTSKGYDDIFQAEVRGIADYQYIDAKGETVMRRVSK